MITRRHTVEMSEQYRDQLAKAIYGRLFSYLVNSINDYLQGQDDSIGYSSVCVYMCAWSILPKGVFSVIYQESFFQCCICVIAHEQSLILGLWSDKTNINMTHRLEWKFVIAQIAWHEQIEMEHWTEHWTGKHWTTGWTWRTHPRFMWWSHTHKSLNTHTHTGGGRGILGFVYAMTSYHTQSDNTSSFFWNVFVLCLVYTLTTECNKFVNHSTHGTNPSDVLLRAHTHTHTTQTW